MVSATGATTPGTLYIVSTPIGNLGDLAPRAVEVLRGVEAILAEDAWASAEGGSSDGTRRLAISGGSTGWPGRGLGVAAACRPPSGSIQPIQP